MTNLVVMAIVLASGDALAGSEVSSFKKESRLGANYWNAASAMDAKPETCWQTDPEQDNAGSWIAVETPKATIDKLGIMVGWNKDTETFKDFARVKKALVEIYETGSGEPTKKSEAVVTFEDKEGWQIVELPDTQVGGEILGGGRVKITVQEVYAGKDFPNLAVSEVRVQLKEFVAGTLRLGTAPASGNGEYLVDGSSRRVWVGDEPTASFSIEAPGYGLSSLGIVQSGKTYARPKTIKIMANGSEIMHTLADKPGVKQSVLLPYLMGYTGGAWGDIQIEVSESYPGSQEKLAIAELSLMAGSIEEI
ncbi:MAG: hypothetical protein AAF602_00025 [Myxococcota bacterium]